MRAATRRRGHPAAALLVALLAAFAAAIPADGSPRTDPRFSGDYCGEHEVPVETTVRFLGWVVSRRTSTLRFAVTARLDERESPGGVGTLRGSGMIEGEGTRLSFALVGTVEAPGAARGRLTVPGLGTATGRAWLRDGGETLVVHGFDHRIQLSKAACGNRRPDARIVRPAAATTLPWGGALELTGSASDPEDDFLAAQRLTWTSSLDGHLGVGRRLLREDLTRGVHDIRFTATDSGGRSSSDSVRVEIANNPPNGPQILTPPDGAEWITGLPGSLRGRATDRESGNLSGGDLTWSSSRDGEIGGGEHLYLALTEGRHTVTLTAHDGDGGIAASSITLDVLPPPAGNAAPSVALERPEDLIAIADFDCVLLVASATDLEQGSLGGDSLAWSTSWQAADGTRESRDLGTGRRVEVCSWPTGGTDTVHTVTATATDSGGLTGSDSVRIYIIPGGLF